MNIPPFTDAATIVDWAREAETAGWDGVFLWDHGHAGPPQPQTDDWQTTISEAVHSGPNRSPA